MKSLKWQLLVWLSGLMTVVGILAGIASYTLGRSEANDFLDEQLRQIAFSVGQGQNGEPALRPHREEAEDRFVMQVWDSSGRLVHWSQPNFGMPRQRSSGFSDQRWKGRDWRVYTLVEPGRTVQISQAEVVRVEMAGDSAFRALAPVAVLIPLSWLLIGWTVARLLKPLQRVAAEAARRNAANGTPLPTDHIPQEILPLVDEVNGLLARLHDALESQRQFVSNAAHELRTPLTALKLQLENLRHCKGEAVRKERIDELEQGIRRASTLVAQLLKLARYEAAPPASDRQRLDLYELLKSCIADQIPLAQQMGVDIGMIWIDHASLLGNEAELRILFGNLLSNAISYTPSGGTVDVSIKADGGDSAVEIVDSGPGIPEEVMPRVFERFFRAADPAIEGSGLGLAIARTIAERHGLILTLANRSDRSGLIACIRISGREGG